MKEIQSSHELYRFARDSEIKKQEAELAELRSEISRKILVAMMSKKAKVTINLSKYDGYCATTLRHELTKANYKIRFHDNVIWDLDYGFDARYKLIITW